MTNGAGGIPDLSVFSVALLDDHWVMILGQQGAQNESFDELFVSGRGEIVKDHGDN